MSDSLTLIDIFQDVEGRLRKTFKEYQEDGFMTMGGDGLNIDAAKLPSYTAYVERVSNIQKIGATFDIFTKTLNFRVVIAEMVDFEKGDDLVKRSRMMTITLFQRLWKLEADFAENNGGYCKGLQWGSEMEVAVHQNKIVMVSAVLGVKMEHDLREDL